MKVCIPYIASFLFISSHFDLHLSIAVLLLYLDFLLDFVPHIFSYRVPFRCSSKSVPLLIVIIFFYGMSTFVIIISNFLEDCIID